MPIQENKAYMCTVFLFLEPFECGLWQNSQRRKRLNEIAMLLASRVEPGCSVFRETAWGKVGM